jgi:hypothetical protein
VPGEPDAEAQDAEYEGEQEWTKGIPLLRARCGEDHCATEDEVGRLPVAPPHPSVQVREVLQDLEEERLAVDGLKGALEVEEEKHRVRDIRVALDPLPDNMDEGLAAHREPDADLEGGEELPSRLLDEGAGAPRDEAAERLA